MSNAKRWVRSYGRSGSTRTKVCTAVGSAASVWVSTGSQRPSPGRPASPISIAAGGQRRCGVGASMIGATGRLYLSGTESEIRAAASAACDALEMVA